MMKKTAVTCLTVLLTGALLLSLTGCETYGQAGGLGAGVGALAGGIIGHQSGRALEGAAIGAALGAATGLIAHDIKAKKMRSREETAAAYNYQNAQGEMLTLERAEILPATARPGEMIDSSIQYALLGTGGAIQVSEQRSLLQNGGVVADLSSQSFTREDGTWVSTQPFRVPSDLAPGNYTILTTVRTSRSAISGQASFSVL